MGVRQFTVILLGGFDIAISFAWFFKHKEHFAEHPNNKTSDQQR